MSGYSETKYSASGVRTGAIMPHGDSSAPVGFLNCDGTAVSRTTYASLFGVIGTTYGSGDGASTFNLPDLRDNVAVGKSSSKSIGSTGGSATQTTTGSVNNHTLTTSQIPAHTHTKASFQQEQGIRHRDGTSQIPQRGDVGTVTGTFTTDSTGGGGAHNHGFTGASMSVLQPYLALNYIIKT
jgi:microcystin-dependent protein